MKNVEFDIAIVGAGCIGSSIGYEIARRGYRNSVIIDNGRKHLSATASSGGMLRVFHENIEHLQLALNNFALLKKYQDRGLIQEKNQPNGHYISLTQDGFHTTPLIFKRWSLLATHLKS